MTLTPHSVLEPVSSGEIQIVDLDRINRTVHRHQLLTEYMALRQLDGVLLSRPENFAWLTGGGDNTRDQSGEVIASLFVTPESRLVLCNSIDSGCLFDFELPSLGFQLKERPWTEDPRVLLKDVIRGRVVAEDDDPAGALSRELADFRTQLSDAELDRLRLLGREVAHSVEAAARTFTPGESEAEVAAQLAHRLIKRGIRPVRLQVLADGQGRRLRHWSHGEDRIERYAVIGAVGRREGLHVGCLRTVCLSRAPQDLLDAHQHAALIQATGMYFSQMGWEFGETWKRIVRIYDKFGAPDEWRLAEQAEQIGYSLCEAPVIPGSSRQFTAGAAIYWHPSVRSAAAGDTMLVNPGGPELITQGENWPQLTIEVKGLPFQISAVLCRESASDWAIGD